MYHHQNLAPLVRAIAVPGKVILGAVAFSNFIIADNLHCKLM
jgi:hypothetical protein